MNQCDILDCFKYAVIDHIISDIPFGQRCGTDQSALRILQRICDIFSEHVSSFIFSLNFYEMQRNFKFIL